MVLEHKDFEKAQKLRDPEIKKLFSTRQNNVSFIVQCSADREIQRLLHRKRSQAYKYNCEVVHNPQAFSQVPEPTK